jgi:hypothetical protein
VKIGIIQVQRLGDLIIALPIAAWFIRQGHEVYWPINRHYHGFLQSAAPDVHFLPLDGEPDPLNPLDFFYHRPLALLQQLDCDVGLPLYYYLEGAEFIDRKLLGSLKFDEYKYAFAGVPFAEKWNLQLVRDPGREKALFYMLGITRPYIIVHRVASNAHVTADLPPSWLANYQIIEITERTDNPLDWIYTIEHAAKRVMIDSSFANLTEQLNITGENYLILKVELEGTPVFRNGWTYCWPGDPIPDRSEAAEP